MYPGIIVGLSSKVVVRDNGTSVGVVVQCGVVQGLSKIFEPYGTVGEAALVERWGWWEGLVGKVVDVACVRETGETGCFVIYPCVLLFESLRN
jgi:hypothetical protein